jgi:hypothetical protein
MSKIWRLFGSHTRSMRWSCCEVERERRKKETKEEEREREGVRY